MVMATPAILFIRFNNAWHVFPFPICLYPEVCHTSG